LFFIAIGLIAIASLWSGPVQLSPQVTVDIHSLLVACFAVIVGSQLVMFNAIARKYAMAVGFLPPATTFKRVLSGLTLERIIQCGLLLFVIGLVGSLWVVYSWAATGFRPITYNGMMRLLAISLTAIVVAVQMVAGAFLSSIFEIRHIPPQGPVNG
jgi:hypothetical protein